MSSFVGTEAPRLWCRCRTEVEGNVARSCQANGVSRQDSWQGNRRSPHIYVNLQSSLLSFTFIPTLTQLLKMDRGSRRGNDTRRRDDRRDHKPRYGTPNPATSFHKRLTYLQNEIAPAPLHHQHATGTTTAEESARLRGVLHHEEQAHHTAPSAIAEITTEALETAHHLHQRPVVAEQVLVVIDANLSTHVLPTLQHPKADRKNPSHRKIRAWKMGWKTKTARRRCSVY